MLALEAHREEDEVFLPELLLFQSPTRPTRGADGLPHPAGRDSLLSPPRLDIIQDNE